MKKIIVWILAFVLILSIAGCSEDTPAENNPLVGTWLCDSDVSHLIENTFGYEDVSFSVQTEFRFLADGTFRFSLKSVNTNDLADIFYQNQGNSTDDLVQTRIDSTLETLQMMNDEGTYRIEGSNVILNGKGTPLTLEFTVNDDGTITMSNATKTMVLIAQ